MALVEHLLKEDEIKSEITLSDQETDSSKRTISLSSCVQESLVKEVAYEGDKLDNLKFCNDENQDVKRLKTTERKKIRRGVYQYACKVCKYITPKPAHFRKHMMIHTGEKPYECAYCQKAFRQKNHLDDHERKHTGKRPYKCEECGSTFVQKSSFNIHKKHAVKIHKKKFALKTTSECNEEKHDKKVCDDLNDYGKCDVRNKIKDEKNNREKTYDCKHCSLKSQSYANLKKHMMIHSGEKPYKCDLCQKAFRQKHHLEDHGRTHTGERPFECEECGSTFVQKSSLNLHRKKHSGVKPYTCSVCDHSTYEKMHLTMHMRTHTGEKPYQCEKCGEFFSSSYRLKYHIMIHTGERRYKCDECGVRFREKVTLQKHKGIHMNKGPFKCDECGQEYPRLASLSLHRKVHTNKKDCFFTTFKAPGEAINQTSPGTVNCLDISKKKHIEESVQMSDSNKNMSKPEDSTLETSSVSTDNKVEPSSVAGKIQNNLVVTCANNGHTSNGKSFTSDSKSPNNKTVLRKNWVTSSPTNIATKAKENDSAGKNGTEEGSGNSSVKNQIEPKEMNNHSHPKTNSLNNNTSAKNILQRMLKQNLVGNLGDRADMQPAFVQAALENGTVMETQDGNGKEFYIVLPPCLKNKEVSVVPTTTTTTGNLIPVLVHPDHQSVRGMEEEEESYTVHNPSERITRKQGIQEEIKPVTEQHLAENEGCEDVIVVEGELADDGCPVEIGELHIDDGGNSEAPLTYPVEMEKNSTDHVQTHLSEQEEIYAEDFPMWSDEHENEIAVTYVIEDGNKDPIRIHPSIEEGYNESIRIYPHEIKDDCGSTEVDQAESVKPQKKRKLRVAKLPTDASGVRKMMRLDINTGTMNIEIQGNTKKTRRNKIKGSIAKVKEKKIRLLKDYNCHQCGKACRTSSNYIAHMRTHSGERPYFCDICGVAFKQIAHLRSHVRIHTGEKPYVCDICNAAFTQSSRLNSHKKTKHIDGKDDQKKKKRRPVIESKVRNFYCKICKKTFINECFKREHMRTHKSEARYDCHLCGVRYKSKASFVKHSMIHCDNRYICEICGSEFLELCDLQQHKITEHEMSVTESGMLEMCINVKIGEDKDFIVVNPSIKGTDKEGDDNNVQIKDKSDSVVLHDGGEVVVETTVTETKTEDAENNEKKDSSSDVQAETEAVPSEGRSNDSGTNINSNSDKTKVECQSPDLTESVQEECLQEDVCSSYTDDTGKKVFVCKVCGKSFFYSSSLKSHARTHTGERPFQCNMCPRSFLQSSNLKTHLRMHTGERPFKCNYCPLAFKQINHLKDHTYRHTVVKPYTCGECGWCFSQRSAITRHISKMHKQGAEIIKNPDCFVKIENDDDSGLQLSKLKRQKNMLSKKPKPSKLEKKDIDKNNIKKEACKVCKKLYNTTYLKIHERCHSGERPYKCSFCGEAFKQKSHLQYHVFRHTGERRYTCQKCEVSFIQSHCFRRHVKKCCGESANKCSKVKKRKPVRGKRSNVPVKQCEETSSDIEDSDSTGSWDSQDECDEVESDESFDTFELGIKSDECSSTPEKNERLKSDKCTSRSYKKYYRNLDKQGSGKTTEKTKSSPKCAVEEIKCKCCGIIFQDLTQYKVHLQQEGGLMEQFCDVCGSTFRRASALKFHQSMKHGMTFDKWKE